MLTLPRVGGGGMGLLGEPRRLGGEGAASRARVLVARVGGGSAWAGGQRRLSVCGVAAARERGGSGA